MEDDPNYDKLSFQQNKIKKLLAKGIKDKGKADKESATAQAKKDALRKKAKAAAAKAGKERRDRGDDDSSSSRTGFGRDVGSTMRGLGGGMF